MTIRKRKLICSKDHSRSSVLTRAVSGAESSHGRLQRHAATTITRTVSSVTLLTPDSGTWRKDTLAARKVNLVCAALLVDVKSYGESYL